MRSMELEGLRERLAQLVKVAEKEQVRVDVKETERTKLRLSVTAKQDQNKTLLKVVELFKSLGGVHERELLDSLETFVSYGLSCVFGEQYKFRAEMSLEGKDLRVEFCVVTGKLQTSVTDAKGGGVAEVVSILLQLFFVVVLGDTLAPFLLLDTAMVHLSKDYYKRMSFLLKELCEELNMQVVLLTHSEDYGSEADKVYKFSQERGKTEVETIK